MNDRLVLGQDLWVALRRHLQRDQNEHLAFILAGQAEAADGSIALLATDLILVDDSDLEDEGHHVGLALGLDALIRVMNDAKRRGLVLIEAHNHPLSHRGVRFSMTDIRGQEEFHSYLRDVYGDIAYAAIVLGDDSVDGAVWTGKDGSRPINIVRILGDNWLTISTTSASGSKKGRRAPRSSSMRLYERQVLALGERGQQTLEELHVGIVGLGGLGSIVAQQLAHLGVRRFTLVDFDVVEGSNLNRLVGARRSDVGRKKVDVAARVISGIAQGTKVTVVRGNVRDAEALDRLKSVDVIFGCVDSDSGRLILNELALVYLIPYIDTGVGIHVTDERIADAGGRVIVWTPGRPCLLCASEVDVRVAAEELETEEQRQFRRERGYLTGHYLPDPSVISLNGTAASLAVTEFLCLVTGLRSSNHYTYYDFLEQRAGPRLVTINEQCVACATYGLGDTANLKRYSGPGNAAGF